LQPTQNDSGSPDTYKTRDVVVQRVADDNPKPIELDSLTKYYGDVRGVEDLTFTVERGRASVFSVRTARVSRRRFASSSDC